VRQAGVRDEVSEVPQDRPEVDAAEAHDVRPELARDPGRGHDDVLRVDLARFQQAQHGLPDRLDGGLHLVGGLGPGPGLVVVHHHLALVDRRRVRAPSSSGTENQHKAAYTSSMLAVRGSRSGLSSPRATVSGSVKA
jgi:hypothetical protein